MLTGVRKGMVGYYWKFYHCQWFQVYRKWQMLFKWPFECVEGLTLGKRGYDKQILCKSSWSHFKTSCWSKHFRTVFTSFVVTYMYHMSNCGLYAINDWVCRLIVYNYVFDLQRSNLSNLTCYIPLWLSHHLHWCNIWSLYLNLFVIFSHVLWFFSNILKWNHMSDNWFLIKDVRYVLLFIESMDTFCAC